MWNRIILIFAALWLLLSCENGGAGDPAAIAFAQNPLMVSCDAAVVDCGLICNASWTASSKDGWVTVLTPDGKSGDALKVRVSANNDVADRNATVTVKAGNAGKVLQLVQYGSATSGFVSETSVHLDTYGTATYISINTDGEWTWTASSAEWLTLEKKGPAALGISAEINFTGESRSAGFTVSSADGSRRAEVTVTQEFSNEKFLASTDFGRRFVYAAGSYIKSVSADSYKQLADGIESFEMSCTLQDGLGGETSPRKRNIYLFKVDMTKATILVTLPDDNNANLHTTQQMSSQLPALQKKRSGLTVYGGTNGDFFYEDSSGSNTYTLQGCLYRGGTCLKSDFYQATNTVFAVFKDGTAKCMSMAAYNASISRIQEAIGGRQHLIKDGVTMEFTDNSQHPRTAVGTSADGKTVWMLVVDGRDELYGTGSFSVSYEVLARILKAAGASDAINLDGGGSSTYVVRESNGSFTRRNKPANAGRTERKVLDGLAIVKS
ncbi:MAG: phosphodiester glycosidase family protein [Bacteroidales bacterium]|nr:phosphodiester glycosidase family protein [Bacteroidales bacterium]